MLQPPLDPHTALVLHYITRRIEEGDRPLSNTELAKKLSVTEADIIESKIILARRGDIPEDVQLQLI